MGGTMSEAGQTDHEVPARPLTVAFSCVTENRPDWLPRVHNLVFSLRTFGGSLAQSPVIVNVVNGAPESFAAPLRALGADVRTVERFDPRTPYANKLRMLEMDDVDCDLVVALDCDVLIVGDLAPHLDRTHVAAKPADIDRLTDDEWQGLFAAFGISAPERTVIESTTGRLMYPYFNSGVLIFPTQHRQALLKSWTELLDGVFDVYRTQPHLVPPAWRFHADQFSLSLALLRDGHPYRSLPPAFNFPTHLKVDPAALDEDLTPLILHYHKSVTPDGFVLRSRHHSVNQLIHAHNAARARHLGVDYRKLPRQPWPTRAKASGVRIARRTISVAHRARRSLAGSSPAS